MRRTKLNVHITSADSRERGRHVVIVGSSIASPHPSALPTHKEYAISSSLRKSQSPPARPVVPGAEVAWRLAQDGFAVVINYARKADEAEALIAKLREGNHTAVAIQADVSKANDIRRLFEVTKRALSKVDVLINNAGILKTVPLTDSSDDQFDQTFAVNARSTFNTPREARKRLNDGGRIINFSSTSLAR
jgi:hypothetical protein